MFEFCECYITPGDEFSLTQFTGFLYFCILADQSRCTVGKLLANAISLCYTERNSDVGHLPDYISI